MTQFSDTKTNERIDALHRAEEERLVQSLAPKYGYSYINLDDIAIDVNALRTITEEAARSAEVAVFSQTKKTSQFKLRCFFICVELPLQKSFL